MNLQHLQGGGAGSFELATAYQRRVALEAVIAEVKYLAVDARLAAVREIARLLEVPLPTELMMSSSDVRAMHQAGMQIGAHTVSHPILATLAPEAARREMSESKAFLENLIREPVSLFAYPNGMPGVDFNAGNVALARELGFEAAFSTARGAATARTDPFQIPRFTPWDRSRLRFCARMLSTLWASRRGTPQLALHP